MDHTQAFTRKTYQINPIGTVRISDRGHQLEIFEPYRKALKELDQFSHVMVFWWAHKHDNPQDRKITQTTLPYAKDVTAGLFACRSEYRPNPIALTTSPILDVDQDNGIVHLAWIDALEGTPIVDLKPYIPVCDRIRDVKVAPWFADWPEWVEDADV